MCFFSWEKVLCHVISKLVLPNMNNKGADQSAYLCSLFTVNIYLLNQRV